MKKFFVLCVVLVTLSFCVTAFATSVPPDGIISTRPGTGSDDFFGTYVFTIFSTAGYCSPYSTGVVSCGDVNNTTGSVTGQPQVVLKNMTGQIIGAGGAYQGVYFLFTTYNADGTLAGLSQGGLQAGANNTLFDITDFLNPDLAFFHSNTNCVSQFVGGATPDPCQHKEWDNLFAQVLVPVGGYTRITISVFEPTTPPGPVPEPASAVLLVSGIGAGYSLLRKRSPKQG